MRTSGGWRQYEPPGVSRPDSRRRLVMPTYLLQDDYGYVGLLEHPAPNLDAGAVVALPDGRQALVTASIGAGRGSRFAAILEVVLLPEPDGS